MKGVRVISGGRGGFFYFPVVSVTYAQCFA